jgi:hypothetical protein
MTMSWPVMCWPIIGTRYSSFVQRCAKVVMRSVVSAPAQNTPPQLFALIEIAAPRRICATVRKSSDAQRRERARAKYPPPAAGEGTPPERPACGRRGHAVMRSVVSAPAQNTPRPQQARVRRPKDPPAAGEGTPPERPAVMH